jgi:hypothetical protein
MWPAIYAEAKDFSFFGRWNVLILARLTCEVNAETSGGLSSMCEVSGKVTGLREDKFREHVMSAFLLKLTGIIAQFMTSPRSFW